MSFANSLSDPEICAATTGATSFADLIISAPLQPEGFGRAISEGLAMKKIVLCYNFGGSKEQILGLDNISLVLL